MGWVKKLSAIAIVLGAMAFVSFKVFVPKLSLNEASLKMDSEEQQYLEKLNQLSSGATLDHVTEIFGRPPDRGGNARPTWRINSRSQIATYFKDGHLFKIRWMKIPGFIVEVP